MLPFVNAIEITRTNVREFSERLLTLSTEYNRSFYDAAYLALSEVIEAPLVTDDKRLYNAVKNKIPSLAWITQDNKFKTRFEKAKSLIKI